MEKRKPGIPLRSKVLLSFADCMCSTLSGLITGGGLTYYYTRWMGLSAARAATVWLIFGIWNAVNDPLFGYISDRTKSKLGRRVPYIRYGAPVYALIFILSWISFPGASQAAMFWQMLATLFLFDTLYTAIATALYVMPYEMTVNNRERGSIFVWKIVFSVFSLAAPLVLLPLIQPDPGEDATMFRLIMAGIGAFAGVVIFVSTFFYHEQDFARQQEQPPFFKAIADCFKNSSFLIFEVLSFTIIYVQTSLMQGVLYYFPEFHASMPVCYGAMAVGAILGVAGYSRLQHTIGVKKCLLIMHGSFGLSCLMMVLFGGVPAVAAAGFFVTGVGFAGGMFMIPIMNGDVIDRDETVTGLRREGMYAGVNSFITKPAISLAQAAFLAVLTRFGYDQTAASGTQSATAAKGILCAWMLIPGILLLVCFGVLFLYRLDGPEWLAQKAALAKAHAEKEALAEQSEAE
jgi:GPH family glycoside/pentoside/hexuronide:cation symporter